MKREVTELKEKHCNTCAFFKQHYGLDGKKLFRLRCGHCMKATSHALSKGRKPDAPICDLYVPGEPDTSKFADREYLSKALLSYVLSLPLLPKIEDK